jgi:hypothetical protein
MRQALSPYQRRRPPLKPVPPKGMKIYVDAATSHSMSVPQAAAQACPAKRNLNLFRCGNLSVHISATGRRSRPVPLNGIKMYIDAATSQSTSASQAAAKPAEQSSSSQQKPSQPQPAAQSSHKPLPPKHLPERGSISRSASDPKQANGHPPDLPTGKSTPVMLIISSYLVF